MWITSNLQHRYTEDIIKAKVIRIEINWKDKHLQKNLWNTYMKIRSIWEVGLLWVSYAWA